MTEILIAKCDLGILFRCNLKVVWLLHKFVNKSCPVYTGACLCERINFVSGFPFECESLKRCCCWVLLYVHRNRRFIRDGEPRTATSTFTQLLSPESQLVRCCFTFTETVGLLGTGAQDGHLDFHTAAELWNRSRSSGFVYNASVMHVLGPLFPRSGQLQHSEHSDTF